MAKDRQLMAERQAKEFANSKVEQVVDDKPKALFVNSPASAPSLTSCETTAMSDPLRIVSQLQRLTPSSWTPSTNGSALSLVLGRHEALVDPGADQDLIGFSQYQGIEKNGR